MRQVRVGLLVFLILPVFIVTFSCEFLAAETKVTLKLKGRFIDFATDKITQAVAEGTPCEEKLPEPLKGLIPNQYCYLNVEVSDKDGRLRDVAVIDDETMQPLAFLSVPVDGNGYQLSRSNILYPKLNLPIRTWVIIGKSFKSYKSKLKKNIETVINEFFRQMIREKIRRKYPFELSDEEIEEETQDELKSFITYFHQHAPKEFVQALKGMAKFDIEAKLYRFGLDIEYNIGFKMRDGLPKDSWADLFEIDLSNISTDRPPVLKYKRPHRFIIAQEIILNEVKFPELLAWDLSSFLDLAILKPPHYTTEEDSTREYQLNLTETGKFAVEGRIAESTYDFYCSWVDPAFPHSVIRESRVASFGTRSWGIANLVNISKPKPSVLNKTETDAEPAPMANTSIGSATATCCPPGT